MNLFLQLSTRVCLSVSLNVWSIFSLFFPSASCFTYNLLFFFFFLFPFLQCTKWSTENNTTVTASTATNSSSYVFKVADLQPPDTMKYTDTHNPLSAPSLQVNVYASIKSFLSLPPSFWSQLSSGPSLLFFHCLYTTLYMVPCMTLQASHSKNITCFPDPLFPLHSNSTFSLALSLSLSLFPLSLSVHEKHKIHM